MRAMVPATEWLSGYERSWLRADVVAGLTTAAVVIPKAMAYATIAGLPLQVGLYTAFIPMVVYAVLGTSRTLSVSTTTTIAILCAAELGAVAKSHAGVDPMVAIATLSLMVGAILLVARALRLGFIANFISDPVLTGFKAGIGMVIVLDQLPKLLGIKIHKEGFFLDVVEIMRDAPGASGVTMAVAAATFAVIAALEKWSPRAPAPLVAIAGGIGASLLFTLPAQGVSVVGNIPGGLPHLVMPDASLLLSMWPAAAGIAMMSFTETITSGRAFARAGDARPDSNQELVATGAGNVVAAFFGAMPAGGGTSQTALNLNTGARTQVAALVTAAMSVATMIFLAPVLSPMPNATLAAVVIAYSIGLISPSEIEAIRGIRNTEFRWALAAWLGVMLLGTLQGILVAVLLSMGSLLYLATNPPVHVMGRKRGTNVFRPLSQEHADDETFPGLVIARTEGRMFFANAPGVAERLRALVDREKPRVLLLDCGAIPGMEFTALKMLDDAEKNLRSQGVALWLAGLSPEALELVKRVPLAGRLGKQGMHFNVEAAVTAYQQGATA
jgi:SulP family sulfate permease